MPRQGTPYSGSYQTLRKRLLAGGKRCAYCSNRATVADHVPPLKLHVHRPSGCRVCHLVPSCATCSARQGALLQRVARIEELDVEVDARPDPIGFDVLDPVWDVVWLDGLRDVPATAVWPRLMTVPHPLAVGTHGPAFERWCRREFGVTLRWWQRLVAYRLLEHDAKGRLLWRTLILTLARQLGKSTLLAAVLMWRMIHGREMFGEEQLMLHTARLTDVGREVQRPGRRWATLRPDEFKVMNANGKEAIEHKLTGSRWLVRAEDAVYGMSATTALADEAWDMQAETVDVEIEPTLVEHEQPQLLLVSTAHRKATSLMLGRRAVALRALDAPGDGDLLIEWSAPRGTDIQDRTAWRLASPHWTGQRERMIEGKVAAALAGKSDDPLEPDPVESVLTQWLDIWPAFGTRYGKGDPLVDDLAWRSLCDPNVETVGALTLAVEDCFGKGASAAAAGLTDDGRVVVGGWSFGSRAEAFAWARAWIDRVPGSLLLVGALLKADVELADMPADVQARGTTESRSALSLLRELVAAGRIVHDGSDVQGQVGAARVTPAPSGGLQLVNVDRFDLVRAVAWAVAECHRMAGLAPAVL